MTDNEINESVARKLGWMYEKDLLSHRWSNGATRAIHIPDYCNNIAAAWKLIPKFNKWSLHAQDEVDVCFSWIDEEGQLLSVTQNTVPMAICLAFLP